MKIPGENVEQLRQEGITTFPLEFSSSDFYGLRADATRVMWTATRIRDPEWQNVYRARFFRHTKNPLKITLHTALWLPAATRVARETEFAMASASEQLGEPELRTTFNRIGVNYMLGTEDHPAIIGQHVDVPAETGVVATIDLGEETMSLIACLNACQSMGISQAIHGYESEESRTSYTFAEFN